MILEANIVDYAFELTRSKSGPDLRLVFVVVNVLSILSLTRSKSESDLRRLMVVLTVVSGYTLT
jgi:hypothetical protein